MRADVLLVEHPVMLAETDLKLENIAMRVAVFLMVMALAGCAHHAAPEEARPEWVKAADLSPANPSSFG